MNTQYHMMSQVQELYKGPQISSAYVYSQVTTIVWAVMTFSATMPFLYVIATVFFGVYFFFYKILLLRFYSKTSTFNEDLPIINLSYMFWGLIPHMAVGLVMLSNKNLLPYAKNDQISQYNIASSQID